MGIRCNIYKDEINAKYFFLGPHVHFSTESHYRFASLRYLCQNFRCHVAALIEVPAGNYMLKVNNRNTRTRCEISSKLTIKTPERCQWTYFTPCCSVSIVNFEQVNTGWGRTFVHSYALLRSLVFAKTHFMWNHSHKKRKVVWNMSMI